MEYSAYICAIKTFFIFIIFEMNLTNYHMLSRGFLLIAFVVISWLVSPFAGHAQTCRVSCNGGDDGGQNFKEVFEYDFVDVKPSFPGGREALMSFINNARKYPQDAYDQGIEGRVTCSFVVNADGNISHLKVIKGCHKSLNMEAMRILAEMPNWVPGRHGDKTVPVRVVHCIPFRR